MNIEYHYYITYLIAVVSGFKMSEAYKIAYSSQHVDDNYLEYDIYNSNGKSKDSYKNLASGIDIKEIFATFDEKIKKILVIFHLLPGDGVNNREDGKEHALTTTKDSKLANMVLKEALNSKNLYWIGIATHAYADSWAHQNFVGTLSDFNAFPDGALSPNLGHCDAFDKPDLVGLIWEDPRLKRKKVNNVDKFLSKLREIMMNDEKNSYFDVKRLEHDRIKKYNDLAKQFTSFDILRYDKNKWYNETIKSTAGGKLFWKNEGYKNYDWYQFQEAVKLHYNFVTSKLLPN